MKRYLLAHDLGTSGNKATLFTFDGQLVDSRVSAYPTDYSHDNWAEQDPRRWWTAVCETTRALLQGRDPKEIAAVCFSGQMMGCLCVDSAAANRFGTRSSTATSARRRRRGGSWTGFLPRRSTGYPATGPALRIPSRSSCG